MGKKKNKTSAKKAAAAASSRGVVGPDYMQVLTGRIAAKSVALILCGESHHDAIDVTRAGGGKVQEGWVAADAVELTAEMAGKHGDGGRAGVTRVKCGQCKRHQKLLPLGKAKEWGRGVGEEDIEYIDHGHEMALLFVPATDNAGSKGRAFVVELFLEDAESTEEERATASGSRLPPDVVALVNDMSRALDATRGVKCRHTAVRDTKKEAAHGLENEKPQRALFSWSDLDPEARQLNRRRVLGEEIAPAEHDALIRARQRRRREEDGTWAWDDWLEEVRSPLPSGGLHVVLESSVPPGEVELCRDFVPDFAFGPAAEDVRCLSEDSDESEADAFDPSSDGFGSYMDFLFRRLLALERSTHTEGSNDFLHCVDCRDLGCEQACVDDSLQEDWTDLLAPKEKERVLVAGPDNLDWNRSPEETTLEQLRSSGVLKNEEGSVDEDGDTEDSGTDHITFPSMEAFFGQGTDIIYYTPHVKVSYFGFFDRVVQSFDNWNSFFIELFFGGTVKRALSFLDLSQEGFLHIRSPLLKYWNATSGEYEWRERDSAEDNLATPLFPIKCFVKARGSLPVRTWSSEIFASLAECDCPELRDMANRARHWALDDITKQCNDPKQSDDEVGGGDWFLAYLRQCHREIYNDIDHSDTALLQQKQSAIGESGRKHKIGNIAIPSLTRYFSTEGLASLGKNPGKTALREAEVLTKILVDVYMSKLVDAAAVVKIAQIIAKEATDKINIVCYMGSVHTRALCRFFAAQGFKKKIFCGKQDWDEEEGRIMFLPKELWDLRTLT